MKKHGGRLTRAAVLSLVALLAGATEAKAQSAGSLAAALNEEARRSGREIIYPAEAVAGRQAPVLDPGVQPEDAIRSLLRGTDLEAEFRRDVIIVRQQRSMTSGAEDPPSEDRTVVVTATRIRGQQPSSPVAVTERRDIEIAGLPDLGEVIRRIPQNFGGGQNPSVAGGGNQGGSINTTGSSNVNLRGLGEDATLTLINGHRVAYDGVSQGIDISAIPVAAISRLEVVADGASALYGSDAVGGVVNVILRNGFDGLLTSVRSGISLAGGNAEEQLGGVAGTRWGGGSVMVAGGFNRNTRISAGQRSYSGTLDPTGTIFPFRRQLAAVLNGRQTFGRATLGLDAEISHRESRYANATSTSGGVTANGLLNDPISDFYAVSPSLRVELPAEWTATVSGTHSRNLADLRNTAFSRSVETGLRLRYLNHLEAGEIGFEGPLAHLPGGAARLAAGGGVRSNDLRVRNTRTTAGVTTTTANYGGQRDVLFGYGELSLPLVGAENGRSGLEQLRFDAAARFEKYQDLSGIVTPKVGMIYAPLTKLTLRATWGRSFKAPTLFQEKQIRQVVLAPGAAFVGTPAGRTVILVAGGGNALGPERARNWSGTVDLKLSKQLTVSSTFFDVRYKDRVTAPIVSATRALADPRYAPFLTINPSAAQLDAIIASGPQGLSNAAGQPYNPSLVYAIINNALTNVAQQHVRGVDLTLDYKASLAGGQSVGAAASVSYLDSDQQVLRGQTPVQRAGTIYDPPHWRGHATATWERDGMTLAGIANYSGENLDDRTAITGAVGSFFTVDASLRVRSPARRGPLADIEAGINVFNILDEKPSGITILNPIEPAYDSTNSSVLGRSISVTLTKRW